MKHTEKLKEMELTSHTAWREEINKEKASQLLAEKPPYTYIMGINEENKYAISWVEVDGSVGKAEFELIQKKSSKLQWCFRNKNIHYHDHIDSLIPKMLHCDLEKCQPLTD